MFKENFYGLRLEKLKIILIFFEKKFGNKIFLKTVKKQFLNICQIIQMDDSKSLFSFVGHSLFGGNMLISVSLIQLKVQAYTEITI